MYNKINKNKFSISNSLTQDKSIRLLTKGRSYSQSALLFPKILFPKNVNSIFKSIRLLSKGYSQSAVLFPKRYVNIISKKYIQNQKGLYQRAESIQSLKYNSKNRYYSVVVAAKGLDTLVAKGLDTVLVKDINTVENSMILEESRFRLISLKILKKVDLTVYSKENLIEIDNILIALDLINKKGFVNETDIFNKKDYPILGEYSKGLLDVKSQNISLKDKQDLGK